MRQMLGEEATPVTRLVELPGRGVTRMWECAGPPGGETLMLIHGLACTAELNWAEGLRAPGGSFPCRRRRPARPRRRDQGRVAVPARGLRQRCRRAGGGPRYRQVHRRGLFHGRHGRPAGVPAARLAAVGSGVVLYRGQRGIPGAGAGRLRAAGGGRRPAVEPGAAAGQRRGPGIGSAGPHRGPGRRQRARAQLGRTTLVSADSAIQAVCQFSSDGWISQVDIPTAVVVTTRDRNRAGWPSTGAGPGDPGRIGPRGRRRSRGMHHRAAGVRPNAARSLLVGKEPGRGRDHPRFGAAQPLRPLRSGPRHHGHGRGGFATRQVRVAGAPVVPAFAESADTADLHRERAGRYKQDRESCGLGSGSIRAAGRYPSRRGTAAGRPATRPSTTRCAGGR